MFALPISMPRFESINFYQSIPQLSYFCKKIPKFFLYWWLRPETPMPPAAAGDLPPGPRNIPPLRILGYAPSVFIAVMLFCVNRFCSSLVFMVFRKRLFL